MRILYSLLLASTLPLIVVRLLWRSLRQRGYREHILERFGRYPQTPLKESIWIHAVSVGETRATQPLIRRLRALYPKRPILLTCMTPTGRATAVELFGDSLTSVYLPYDLVVLQRRLIAHFKPSILLVMETEIWPNLLHACQQRSIPALIANARLSETSFHAYARLAPVRRLIREALQSVHTVAAQSAADAQRLRLLGARKTVVTGNIKFDVQREPQLEALGLRWKSGQAARRVVLCASTREGEEALLLAAYGRTFDAAARQDTLLVLVPRHPQRFDEVAGEIERAGLRFARRGQLERGDLSATEVLLGDSMGEMMAYYAMCDVAIIGGSFLPLGGQNLIEACALGKPVIMGPSTFNFTESARLAAEAGAMRPVMGAVEAMQTASTILEDEQLRSRMADAGRKLVDANRGATAKTVELISAVLGAQ